MSAPTLAPAALDQAAPPLDLEARLALTLAVMGPRLDWAAVRFEVNTAHISGADPVIITGPVEAPELLARPYATPIAACLQRAHVRLQRDGWCTGQARNPDGATCLYGAIRAEAAGASVEEASAFLLGVIQQQFTADTVPSWNDQQTDPRAAIRILGQAADQAAARGI